ncbi:ribokinase [Chitinibacter bivalviorum]|uniref:Ribokinase n=1 Tax=Chitinibacter bivalviorum TaxID=2739434 RepID=A0A7H9BNU1_9NEIS|nr:ribokinase [Chitinibacter bivalviorum]QLG88994.1 ribokinase [Chitinibacter bivalviorum]
MSKVLVVGSINMDLVVQVEQFPRLGETLLGQHFATHHGGKGANQAVAAARLGAQVTMIGRVGDDAFGRELKDSLSTEGINTEWIKTSPNTASGIAMITLAGSDNAIIVVPGANAHLSPADIEAAEAAFIEADVVIAQLETPLASIEMAALLAQRYCKPFILNPAPAMRLPASLLDKVALLTPNEFELGMALGRPESEWQQALQQMPGKVLMTAGGDGAWFTDAAGQLQQQTSFKVTPVDTTGAGDTFNGALTAFWDLGLPAASRMACAAGALSVTKAGAQGGMPTRAELLAFLADVASTGQGDAA